MHAKFSKVTNVSFPWQLLDDYSTYLVRCHLLDTNIDRSSSSAGQILSRYYASDEEDGNWGQGNLHDAILRLCQIFPCFIPRMTMETEIYSWSR